MKNILIACIFFTVSLSSFGFSEETRRIQFFNTGRQGFVIKIKTLGCDTSIQWPEIIVNQPDTTFTIDSKFQNIMFILLNQSMRAQVSFMMFADTRQQRIEFNLTDSMSNFIPALKSIEIIGSKASSEFGKVFGEMLVLGFSGQTLDTLYYRDILTNHILQNENNYFACWLILKILPAAEILQRDFFRNRLRSCKHMEKLFYPSVSVVATENFKKTNIFYDTLLSNLNKYCEFKSTVDQRSKFQRDTCILIFWASWCGPCIQQIRAMSELQKISDRFYFISVDLDKTKGVAAAQKLNIDSRLSFIDPNILSKFGYSSIPLHLQLLRKTKQVLEE